MKFIKAVLIFVFFLGASPSLRADDIEIYLNPNVANAGDALVMFHIDWRPSLGAQKCNGTVDIFDNPDPPAEPMVIGQENECQFLVDAGYLRSVDILDEQDPPNVIGQGVPGDIVFFELIRAAMKFVLDEIAAEALAMGLPLDLKVGLMINHDNINNCEGPSQNDCSNGGYVLKDFVSVTDSTSIGLPSFYAKLDAIPIPQGMESHKFQGKEHYFEFFLYLTGLAVFNGHNGWVDYGTDNSLNINDDADTFYDDAGEDVGPPPIANIAEVEWDPLAEDPAGTYKSPLIGAAECSGIFAINMMFQVSQQEDDSDTAIINTMTGIDLSPPDNTFDTVIAYLHDTDLADGINFNPAVNLTGDQTVKSYFLVDPTKINNTTNGYAEAGGTDHARALSDSPEELIKAFEDIFDEILSVSTSLASPAIPVDVFNLAQSLPEAYLSLFEANADGNPRWDGNLKKLKIGEIVIDPSTNPPTTAEELQDAQNPPQSAVDTDGRIKYSARTYWTHAEDLPDPPVIPLAEVGKDGRAVTLGGAGGVIPGYRPLTGNTPGTTNPVGNTTETSTRKLFTEPAGFVNPTGPDSPTTFIAFNADNGTAIDLLTDSDQFLDQDGLTILTRGEELYKTVIPSCGASGDGCDYDTGSPTTQDTDAATAVEGLIAHARGLDDGGNVRSWIMGAPLHSRPLPLSFGSDTRIVMSTNDGIVHMFGAGDNDGVEDWGFIPRAVMLVQKRLKDNNPGTPIIPYTIDDSPTALVIDHNGDGNIVTSGSPPSGGDRVYVYIGMRRGGKGLYALDVSDADDPKLLWRNEKDVAGSDFAELGQTWSTPRVVDIRVGSLIRPALIFGGGYNGDDAGDKAGDLGKDARPPAPAVGTNDGEGNAIFIVDALTGDLIWKAIEGASTGPTTDASGDPIFTHTGLVDSIPSRMTALDTFGNGLADRAYVGTSGGDVWRVDFGDPDPSLWTITKVLELGRHSTLTPTTADDRRFFHQPDFVLAQDDTGDFQAIVIASGDRPHPNGLPVENWLYMFKDRNTTTGFPPGAPKVHTDLADLTSNCLQGGDPLNCNATETLELDKLVDGWRIKLEQCEQGLTGICGEKGLASPVTIAGTVFVNTYIPHDPTAPLANCEPVEGTGLFYAVDLQNATALFDFDQSSTGLERFDTLDSAGIPAENVPYVDSGGYTGILAPDLDFLETNAESQQETFWYEQLFQ